MNLTEAAVKVQKVKASCKNKAQRQVADRYEKLFMNMVLSENRAMISAAHIERIATAFGIGIIFAIAFWAWIL